MFVLVNVLIITTLSLVCALLGIQPYLTAYGIDYSALWTFCLVWGMGGAFISLAMSRMMAKWAMGVKVVPPETSDPEKAGLVRLVYKLASSAGLPAMPEVGIYYSPEINAFATGPTKSRALVAVSSGLLENMDADQIEGVLAHEITHVANGDMVTMTLLQGIINAIVMALARIIGFALASKKDSDDNGSVNYMLYNIIVILLEWVLSLFGMIAVCAFSRYREYKADEGGARLAGKQKMINALKSLQRSINLADMTHAKSIAAFKISGSPGMLFATHPKLEDRIKRLEESYWQQ